MGTLDCLAKTLALILLRVHWRDENLFQLTAINDICNSILERFG